MCSLKTRIRADHALVRLVIMTQSHVLKDWNWVATDINDWSKTWIYFPHFIEVNKHIHYSTMLTSAGEIFLEMPLTIRFFSLRFWSNILHLLQHIKLYYEDSLISSKCLAQILLNMLISYFIIHDNRKNTIVNQID